MSRLRVLLGDPDGRSRNRIKKMLAANGYSVVAETTDGMSTLRQARMIGPDIAVLSEDLSGMTAFQIVAVLMDDHLCPAILVSTTASPEFIEAAKRSGVLGFVPRPVQEYVLIATLELAYETYRRLNQKEHEIEDLRTRLEERKKIEKAKGIIMQALQISEGEAYRYLQKRSMNQKLPMKQIAEAIILASEALDKEKP